MNRKPHIFAPVNWASAAAAIALALLAPAAEAAETRKLHALSLVGEPKYGPDFKQLDYADPTAPKGGTLRLSSFGGFDTLNPFIIKGNAADGLGRLFESLMTTPSDDMGAEYGLIAESVEVPDDLSYVIFNLRPEARFHDGSPITAEDVVFSFTLLVEQGRPHYRFYYQNVVKAEALAPRRVKFSFSGPPNRELPQIMGQLTVLSKAYWQDHDFSATTLEPPLGSGPYKVKALEPNRWITYQRVADYWGKDLPINRGRNNFDEIRYDVYRDQTVALEAFKAGEYDLRNENASKAWATAYDFPALRAGDAVKEEMTHERPQGMQGFAYNLRRPVFQNRTLRAALAYAFDFEWSNQNLFYGQYRRTESFFANSELAATGLPSAAELKFLEPLRDKLPKEVFEKRYQAPTTAAPGSLRQNLRSAARMLKAAGFRVEGGKLIDPKTSQAVAFEVLLVSPAFERVVLPFAKNLERLGVKARVRVVDPAQYINRLRDFDFDMVVGSFPQSLSPGNEQRDYWGSEAADRPASRNIIGIKDPAIDKLIDHIIFATNRADLVAASRALDRALLSGHYVIPQHHILVDRVAYWNKFGRPPKQPKYGMDLYAWWIDAAKAKALRQKRGGAQAKE